MMQKIAALILVSIVFWTAAECKTAEKKDTPVAKEEKPVKKGPSYLGIVYMPTLQGARVVDVMPESPAARAGIVSGDLIVKANGMALRSSDTLKRQIFSQPPGTEVELTIQRAHTAPLKVVAVLEVWDGRMPYEMKVEQ